MLLRRVPPFPSLLSPRFKLLNPPAVVNWPSGRGFSAVTPPKPLSFGHRGNDLCRVMQARRFHAYILLRQVAVHPVQDLGAHFWKLYVRAIEELDVAVGFFAVLAIERQEVVSNFVHTSGRSEGILAPIHAQMSARHDQ